MSENRTEPAEDQYPTKEEIRAEEEHEAAKYLAEDEETKTTEIQIPPEVAEALGEMARAIVSHAEHMHMPEVRLALRPLPAEDLAAGHYGYMITVGGRGFPNSESVASLVVDAAGQINKLNDAEKDALLVLVETARKREGLRSLDGFAWTDIPDEDEPDPAKN